MSEVVLGIGTSHSPLLAMEPEMWVERARDDYKRIKIHLCDGRVLSYEQLAQDTGNRYANHAVLEHFRQQHAAAQKALDRLAECIEKSAPDVVVIIGDDQDELFHLTHMPAIAIFYGKKIVMHPTAESEECLPAWHRAALRTYSQDAAHVHEGDPEYALKLIDGLIERGVDIGGSSEVTDPKRAGFGHAYGFVIERLFRGRRIPVVPVLLNTYFPPNVLRPARCFDIGRALRDAVDSIGDRKRVAVVASGGLSHFATDAEFDRRVLKALADGDGETLRSLPVNAFRSGSSEILNWIMFGGALHPLRNQWLEYLPVYRTPAGTGIGLAFGAWLR
jgi:Catalytic LigB subunit of aromatic ring-opening dioxygenase